MNLPPNQRAQGFATSSPRSTSSIPKSTASPDPSLVPSRHPQDCKCATRRPDIYLNPGVKTQIPLSFTNGPLIDPCVKSDRCFLCNEERHANRAPLRHFKGCKCCYLPGIPARYTARAEKEVFSRQCVRFCRCQRCAMDRSVGRDHSYCSIGCNCLDYGGAPASEIKLIVLEALDSIRRIYRVQCYLYCRVFAAHSTWFRKQSSVSPHSLY